MSYLLDTNVISEIRRPKPNARVASWFEEAAGEDLFLSVLVVGEIRQGIERLRMRDPKQAVAFERWLDSLQRDFGDRLLPVSRTVADAWGRLNAPAPLPVVDSLLAATAPSSTASSSSRATPRSSKAPAFRSSIRGSPRNASGHWVAYGANDGLGRVPLTPSHDGQGDQEKRDTGAADDVRDHGNRTGNVAGVGPDEADGGSHDEHGEHHG